MFERFTDTARRVIVLAQEDARRLGHNYLGSEHLLLAAAATGEAAGEVLRDHGVTPERVQAEILRTIGRGQTACPPDRLDREALAFIGIDIDIVRARIEAAFGQDALTRAIPATRQRRAPAMGKGPLAELRRRRSHRRARRTVAAPAGLRGSVPLGQAAAPRGHIPLTPQAKVSLHLSLREAEALHDSHIGVQHLTLALLALKDGTVPVILSALDTPTASLRAAVLARYRKAS